MRVAHRYIIWDSHTKIIKPVQKILDRYNIPYKYKEDLKSVIPSFKYSIEFNLYEDYAAFNSMKKEIDMFKIEPQTGTHYEKADIINAEWFIARTGNYQYPQPENSYLQATYNLSNYCYLCGIGKIQNLPFRLKTEPKQSNNQFWGLHWEYEPLFIRQEVKNILEKEQVKGIRFSQPVLHKNNLPTENFYQLHINTVLDEGFDYYNTDIITCKINNEEGQNTDSNLPCCGRLKYHHPMIGGYLFNKAIFNPDFDIVMTREYFGSGASANRLIIVSKQFKKMIEKSKLKGLSFIPVMHERLIR